MDPDDKVAIYNKGVLEGMKHARPSSETNERLKRLEDWKIESERMHQEQREFMLKLEGIPDEMKQINKTMQDIVIALEAFKPVSKMVYGGAALILMMFMTAVVASVVK